MYTESKTLKGGKKMTDLVCFEYDGDFHTQMYPKLTRFKKINTLKIC